MADGTRAYPRRYPVTYRVPPTVRVASGTRAYPRRYPVGYTDAVDWQGFPLYVRIGLAWKPAVLRRYTNSAWVEV